MIGLNNFNETTGHTSGHSLFTSLGLSGSGKVSVLLISIFYILTSYVSIYESMTRSVSGSCALLGPRISLSYLDMSWLYLFFTACSVLLPNSFAIFDHFLPFSLIIWMRCRSYFRSQSSLKLTSGYFLISGFKWLSHLSRIDFGFLKYSPQEWVYSSSPISVHFLLRLVLNISGYYLIILSIKASSHLLHSGDFNFLEDK